MPFDEATVEKTITVILHLAEEKDWKILRLFHSQSVAINGTLFAGDNATLMTHALDKMLNELGYISQDGESTFSVTQQGIEAWSLRKERFRTDDDEYQAV